MLPSKFDKEKVQAMLEADPKLRDNVLLLILRIWRNDFTEKGNLFPTYEDFEDCFLSCKLTHISSIERYFRMIQEHHPELRGSQYGKRHLKAEVVAEHCINSKVA